MKQTNITMKTIYEDPMTTMQVVEMEMPLMKGSPLNKMKMSVSVDDWEQGFDDDDQTAGLDKISFD